MTFATLWKIGSGQFLDGDTMRYTPGDMAPVTRCGSSVR